MNKDRCQLYSMASIPRSITTSGKIRKIPKRLKRIIKRRWRYAMNYFSERIDRQNGKSNLGGGKSEAISLNPGDSVLIRSEEEIQQTLDRWNRLNGCSFMEEMWAHCGTTQRVLKKVEKFLDERDYLTKKCRGIVILDGVFCEGTTDFGPCDRTCFFFWKEEWLRRI